MFGQKKSIAIILLVIWILILSGSLDLPEKNSKNTLSPNDSAGMVAGSIFDSPLKGISSYPGPASPKEESDNNIILSTLSVSYSFSQPVMDKSGEYYIPRMDQLRNENIPGSPILPYKNAQILLPQGETLRDVEVITGNEIVLEGEYLIKPGEKPQKIGEEEELPTSLEFDQTIYSSNENYPKVLSSDPVIQGFRGFQIMILNLYPMQYIPTQKKVLYYESIEVIVTTVYSGTISGLYRGLPEDKEIVKKIVDNPSVADSYKYINRRGSENEIRPLSLTNSSESFDYVIITNDALASTFWLLADQKNTSGIQTTVVKIEDITSDPDYNGTDTQEKVRNFIKDAYINWSISYVLLGGDDEIIPHRGCYGYVFSISGPEEDLDIPTDLYYGGLDGNWNNDGDSIYGEMNSSNGGGGTSGEEADLFAEVFVGRAPVNTLAEVQTFVDKVIFFEANPRPKHVMLHGEEDINGNHIEKVKNNTGGYAALGVEYYIPSIYNITRLYEAEGHAITKAIWTAEIANNTLFINHGGHGQVNSYEIKGEGFISYTKSDAASVINSYYPIHLSIACYSGSFDGRKDDNTYVADNDCIAEKYITNSNGGMVACILNSRYGWFVFGDVTAYSGELDNEFYNQLFNNNEMRIGKTMQKAKEVYASDALTHTTYRWVYYEWNLLGDPTMLIFGQDSILPIADAGPDNATGTDQPIMLDGSNSTDDSGYLAWYNWTFGDGNYFNGSGPINAKVVHEYTDPGIYNVTLNVSDAWGNWDTDNCTITVWDGTPPTTNLTISDPKYREYLWDDWNITQTTSFELNATDEYSGVKLIWYKIDGQYFEYTGVPFTLSGYGEGPHNISWGAEDNSGNNGTEYGIFWIDESEPNTQLSINEPRHPDAVDYGCNVTSFTIFILTGQDQPAHDSGIAFSWLTIDSDYYKVGLFDLSSYGEGQHTITWGSEDNLGNNETANSIVVWVDDTKPQTMLSIDQPKYPNSPDNGCNVTNTTVFTLASQDFPAHNAGVAIIWYTIDSDYYEGPSFNLIGYTEGQHTIKWGSIDNVGNNETGNIITIWLDDSEPITNLNIGSPKHPLGFDDGTNVTSTTQFILAPQDYPLHSSGIFLTWYKIDSDYYEDTVFNLTGYSEGAHTIAWGSEDHLGHNETNMITIWLDDSAPQTELTIGPERFPSVYDGCNVTADTKFTFTPEDYPAHNSSVKLTWYTLNGRYYLGTNFTLADFGLNEGPHNITWGGIDFLGNNETGNLITVYLDKKSPVTALEIGEPKTRNIGFHLWNVSGSTPFILNSTDSYSGVAFSWYIIDGQYFKGSIFNLTGFMDGLHTIIYGSQDNLEYNETQKALQVILDTTPPQIILEIGEPKYRADEDDYWNVTASTLFTIQAIDDYSGVEVIWHMIDGEYIEGSSFTLFGRSDGMHIIDWGARDKLGNNISGSTIIVYADTHYPITNLTIVGPKYRMNNNESLNVTSQTLFNLDAEDQYSQVNFTWYTIDGNYFENISFDLKDYDDGMHIITWGSMDFAGNNETGNIIYVFLDDSPPATDIQIGIPKYRESNDDFWNVTGFTNFTLIGSDTYSGINVTWYTIDSEYFEGNVFNISDFPDGDHVITYGSLDNLNHNETSSSLIIYLDCSTPSTNLSLGEPKYRANEGDIWNVTQTTLFSFSASDKYSGVAVIWYTLDGQYLEGNELRLQNSMDGLHTIVWGTKDNLGNNETGDSMDVFLDTKFPFTTIYIDGEIPEPGVRVRMNTTTLVNLSAEDGDGVGVDFIWYSLDGGSTFNVYENEFNVTLGTSTIVYGAKDKLGNNATFTTTRVFVVEEKPPDNNATDNGNGDNGEDDEDLEPATKGIFEMLMDYMIWLILIIIIIVIIIVILALIRRKKGKKEIVDFQTQPQQPVVTMQMEDNYENVTVEFTENKVNPPPPPPPQ